MYLYKVSTLKIKGFILIEYIHEISNEDGYKRYSKFQISETLKYILFDDYYLYGSTSFNKMDLIEELYKKNFSNKYDREGQAEIFKLYIDNQAFKDKTQFVYSLIDYDKYVKFVKENENIENPGDYTITYDIVDSDGVKVTMYSVNIADIAFVF